MSRVLIVFSLLLFFATQSLQAQTFYQLKYSYTFPEGKEVYKAFILRFDDGTGLMRVSYNDPENNKLQLVEMDMAESWSQLEDGSDDTTRLIFVGLNARKILGDNGFGEDHFVFHLNEQDGFFEPEFVFTIEEDSTQLVGQFEEVEYLEENDLTEDRILQFFTQEDDFYKRLFTEAVPRGLTAEQKKTRLHLLLVANTKSSDVGPTAILDKKAMYNLFSDVADVLKIEYKPVIIDEDNYSKVNVDNAISALRPAPNDIVVFYYTGHGFNYVQEAAQFPFLDLRSRESQDYGGEHTLNVESVFMKLKAKGARFNLVISDCCNNDPESSPGVGGLVPTTRSINTGWDVNKCIALFMAPSRRSILLTAARKGEMSAGIPGEGGICTFTFKASLSKSLNKTTGPASWEQILEEVKKNAYQRSRETWCNKEKKIACNQHAVTKVD